ncbi:MAG: flagellar motor protein MotB [Desulfohalobiaceae bacterium]
MARNNAKRKKGKKGGGQPAWLITFSDMMTLLLTFFILLLSMAALKDERKEVLVLGSISRTFGMGEETMSILGQEPSKMYLEPGAIRGEDPEDLSSLKNLLWEEQGQDLEFQSNAFIQVLSINSALLFAPGSSQLTEEGQDLLTEIAPELQDLPFPVLLAGHTSILADELDIDYLYLDFSQEEDPSWDLSLQRVQSVYRFFLEQGLEPESMQLEAYGRYNPKFSNQTRKGRQKNRRVDIVLDKRNYIDHVPNKLRNTPDFFQDRQDSFEYQEFQFDLDQP